MTLHQGVAFSSCSSFDFSDCRHLATELVKGYYIAVHSSKLSALTLFFPIFTPLAHGMSDYHFYLAVGLTNELFLLNCICIYS